MVNGVTQTRSEQKSDVPESLASMRDISRQVAAMQSSVARNLDGVRQLFGTVNFRDPVGRRPEARALPAGMRPSQGERVQNQLDSGQQGE